MNIIIQVAIKGIFLKKIFNLPMTATAFWKNLGLFGEPNWQDWRCSACKKDFKFKHNAVLKKQTLVVRLFKNFDGAYLS